MKAVVIDKFSSNLQNVGPVDAPVPTPNGPRELQIKITHAALTHVDLLYAQGLHQNNRRHVVPPFILGTEFAGIVTSSPPSSSLKPGTRVFGSALGSFAEFICANEGSVRKVPDNWTNAEACAVGASGVVSWASLVPTAKLQKGESVLILGASGGLGIIAVQVAKAIGAKVIAVVGDEEKAKLVRAYGADEAVRYDNPGWEDTVKGFTEGGEGVDAVYDAVGAVQSGIKCLKYRGRVVIVGFAGRGGNIEEIKVNRILLKSATVMGYRFGEHGRRFPRETEGIWDGFMKFVDNGSIKPVIFKDKYDGLSSIPRALEDLKGRRTWGRAVLTINDQAEQEQKAKL